VTVHERPVGATVEWYTPPALFDALGWDFDLDPASPGAAIVPWVPADRHLTRADDGLAHEWQGRVWLNPPYGPPGVAFIERMLEHRNGLLLLPARTETAIFQRAMAEAEAVCFLRDRLHFIRDDGFQARSSFGSVLFAWCRPPLANLSALGHTTVGGGWKPLADRIRGAA
jgi:hypothetical protein